MKEFVRTHRLFIAIIFIITIFLTRNLWGTRGWIETHDGIYHLVRQEVFADALKQGSFPVRWIGSLDNGFGLPLFNYIYPGPYYLGFPLSVMGISSKWVIKIVEILLYFLGAFGTYLLFAKKDHFIATVSSILYLTSPYLILNIFVRGALGELMAISCIPWILLSLSDMKERGIFNWYHSIPYFLMFISHNFLSFLFIPIYTIITYFNYRTSWKLILKSFLISLCLSAFFIIPMIFEQKYLYSIAHNDFTYSFGDHFVYPIQLIIGKWGNGFSYPGINDGMSFALGFSSIAILVSSIYIAIKKRNFKVLEWLTISLLTIFFLLPYSKFIWDLIPPLQMIQFPWRLLSFTVISIPILGFYLMSSFKKSRLFYIAIYFFLALSIVQAYLYTRYFYLQNNNQLMQQLYLSRSQTTTSSRLEFLPRWGSKDVRYIGTEDIRIANGSAEVSNISLSTNMISFTADSKESGTIFRIRRNYYPSWFVTVDSGHHLQVTPTSDGLIDFTGIVGIHTYYVQVGSTYIEIIGNLITILAFIYLISLVLRPRLKKYIDEHFDGWDISIALRYLPIADAINKLAGEHDKILEIGSEITGITPYLRRKITGLDQGFDLSRKNKYLNPVTGSATDIPFKDKSYSYVISVDCLEHIPKKLRKKAVSEMMRVASKQVYLSFPVGKESEQIDILLDNYFYARNGVHFNYLKEHVDNGLPSLDFIPKIMADYPDWSYTVAGNTSNWLWVILLKMGLSDNPFLTSIYRRLLLLMPILKHCNFAPTYRLIYILTRKIK